MRIAVNALTAAALVAAAMSATPSLACAEEWHYETYKIDDTMNGYSAYVLSDNREYTLGFECDDYWNVSAIYVRTPVRWEATTSYAPDVPTRFDDGRQVLDVAGAFEERNGQLYVFYHQHMMAEGAFDAVFNLLVESEGPLHASFFTYHGAFQMERARERIAQAAYACENRRPNG